MRALGFLGPVLLVLGVACLAFALVSGEADLSLVVIFPVIHATGPWSYLGILFVVAGFFTTFLLWPARIMATAPSPSEQPWDSTPSGAGAPRRSRWGAFVFLGPLPIVFGSDSRITWAMLLVGVVLFLALLGLTLFNLFG